MISVDVIIPTYKPDQELFQILDMLKKQTVSPKRIILMNTEEKFFDQIVFGTDFSKKYDNCRVYHISKKEFDHAKTRSKGVANSDADYFVMMTQDAMPKDEFLLEHLLKPLVEEKAVVSYARQLPKKDCHPIEVYTRNFNYPDESKIKGEEDLDILGIKTYFCSDVCAAYSRKCFDELGGFVDRAIFNEDMLYAAKASKAGKKIAYCSDACVYHSHNYSAKEQFKRNFDNGVSQADHPEVFEGISSEGEGIKMVKQTAGYLWSHGYKRYLFRLVYHSGAKWLGFRYGKKYKKLSDKKIMKYTSNPGYWRRYIMKRDVSGIDASKGYGSDWLSIEQASMGLDDKHDN